MRLILEGNDQNHDAVTDWEGQYQFVGLPPGVYRVRAELPDHLSFKEQTIKVTGQVCVPLDITALRDGQIAGRVLDVDGQPVASVPVSLVSANAGPEEILSDIKDRGAWTFGVTNDEGRLNSRSLLRANICSFNPAEYEKTRGNEKAQTIPRLFYPGITDMEQAAVITVRVGQKAREYDFRLLTR